eukprot:1974284-Amphidinium_carterae.1
MTVTTLRNCVAQGLNERKGNSRAYMIHGHDMREREHILLTYCAKTVRSVRTKFRMVAEQAIRRAERLYGLLHEVRLQGAEQGFTLLHNQ